MRRFELVAATVAAVMVAGAGFARAEEPKAAEVKPVDENLAKVIDLEKQYRLHLDDKAAEALKSDCKTALQLAGQFSEAKLKVRCLNVIGMILSGAVRMDDVRTTALKTIADSGEKELFHFVKPFLAQPNDKVVPPLLMDAIDCAGKLKAGDAVDPMLDLEADSDVYTVGVAAVKALSNYGDVKAWRVHIVKELIDDLRKDRPSVTQRWKGQNDVTGGFRYKTVRKIRTNEDSRNRFEALSGEVVACCNKLTGQNVASAEDWFALIEKYKTNPEALFGGK